MVNHLIFKIPCESRFGVTTKQKPTPLEKSRKHFDRWLQLFEENIAEHFEGEVADHTEVRAKSIAHMFQSKLEFLNQQQ